MAADDTLVQAGWKDIGEPYNGEDGTEHIYARLGATGWEYIRVRFRWGQILPLWRLADGQYDD
jgi:hypothetical protein